MYKSHLYYNVINVILIFYDMKLPYQRTGDKSRLFFFSSFLTQQLFYFGYIRAGYAKIESNFRSEKLVFRLFST